ncbi:uncharacterized protein LOC119370047 [Jatropha curcas]|uniref:uncharacterized protein LOC119370047 n=1 Tax=Jatropha curcas TaxID=180498 RepID=UPI0018949430|nr:uncharacterized protein LOC119370047 [Jatropha curcas]
MSQHLSNEEVDSYVPPNGGIAVGDVANGAMGSDAEHASRVGQAAAGPAGPNQDMFFQQLVAALRQAARAVPQAPVAPTPIPVRPPIEKLRKYGAVEFRGRKDDMASAAEYWLQSLERILEKMQCSPIDSLVCATSLLKEEAYQWWTTVSRIVGVEQRTWNFFLSEFRQKYIGELYIDQRKAEFLELKQGRMTVSEYEREFIRLSRYATYMIPTELERCKRFRKGLHDEYRMHLVIQPHTSLSSLVKAALELKEVRNEQ